MEIALTGIENVVLQLGDKEMKTLFFLVMLCVFCGAAFGQSIATSAANSQAQMFYLPENPLHATQTPMAQPQDLLEHSGNAWAPGERPLWEVAPKKAAETPLGDIARALRQEHATAKKAAKVWTN